MGERCRMAVDAVPRPTMNSNNEYWRSPLRNPYTYNSLILVSQYKLAVYGPALYSRFQPCESFISVGLPRTTEVGCFWCVDASHTYVKRLVYEI